MSFGDRKTWFHIFPLRFTPYGPWASHLNIMNLSFLICEMDTVKSNFEGNYKPYIKSLQSYIDYISWQIFGSYFYHF